MTIGIIGVVILIALVGLFLVWRTVKLFIKLALVGIVVLLVVGLLAWWNSSSEKTATPPAERNRPANTRRSSNR
ncbi:MAG: hypothetical protein ACR2G4_16765 [Pyrinomonadaceae bacterium]